MRQNLSQRVPGFHTGSDEPATIAARPTSRPSGAREHAAAGSSAEAWIQQAQSRFAEAARVASEAQERTTHVVNDALGTLGQRLVEIERKVETAGGFSVAEALQRIESRLGAARAASMAETSAPASHDAPVVQDALHGFEDRIAKLTDRLAATSPAAARRTLRPDDLKAAVAQIRSRQIELDAGQRSPRTLALDPGASFAAAATDRAQATILLSLRGDMAKLASQLETVRGPDQAAIDRLNDELASLRRSVGSLATRKDLAGIERSLAELSAQAGEARAMGNGFAQVNAELGSLQSAVRQLADTQKARDERPTERAIEELSAKLDAIARTGADPALLDAMTRQLHEIRSLAAGVAAPAEIAALGRDVAALRDDLVDIAGRQIDPSDFASLRSSVEDVRQAVLSSGSPGRTELADGLRPVESLLHALVDKLDGVQRQVAQRNKADPDALDALERQISDLAARFGETSGRDPAIAHLESAMSGLMGEIATWRDDAFEAAERAARKAVAETLSGTEARSAPSPALERDIADLRLRCDTSDRRTEDSLAAVARTLEAVADRIATLSEPTTGSSRDRPASATEPAFDRRAPAKSQPDSRKDLLAEAERPVAPRVENEILLEPGTARPRAEEASAIPSGAADSDIKSSFIAAARRAAQAAAMDAATVRTRGAGGRTDQPAAVPTTGKSNVSARLRARIERHRRPLLLGAAALVLAMGAIQFLGGTPSLVSGSKPAVERTGAAARPSPEASAALDPVTTQSISPRSEVRPAEPVAAAPARPDLSILPAPAAPVAAAPIVPPAAPNALASASALPSAVAPKPATPGVTDAALTAGLKQAALAGNPAASYEYAARAADGRGIAKDPQFAARLFEKAAEKGLAPAQYRLGNIYEKGIGVTRDVEIAKTWYRRAADGGNARAMHNLAVLLAEGSGGKPDYAAAIAWFSRAAEHGIRDSQYNLAVLYARGLGTTQDLEKSYLWFAVAAAEGDADSGKKRDDIGARLSAADLARVKTTAERWRVTPPNPAANEVPLPANGWSEPATTAAAGTRKPGRDGRG